MSLESIELRLLNDQVAALRAFLCRMAGTPKTTEELLAQVDESRQAMQPAAAFQSLPATCEGIEPSSCGHQDEEARLNMATFNSPMRWRCRGCHLDYDL